MASWERSAGTVPAGTGDEVAPCVGTVPAGTGDEVAPCVGTVPAGTGDEAAPCVGTVPSAVGGVGPGDGVVVGEGGTCVPLP